MHAVYLCSLLVVLMLCFGVFTCSYRFEELVADASGIMEFLATVEMSYEEVCVYVWGMHLVF